MKSDSDDPTAPVKRMADRPFTRRTTPTRSVRRQTTGRARLAHAYPCTRPTRPAACVHALRFAHFQHIAVTGLGGLRLPPPWILSEALTAIGACQCFVLSTTFRILDADRFGNEAYSRVQVYPIVFLISWNGRGSKSEDAPKIPSNYKYCCAERSGRMLHAEREGGYFMNHRSLSTKNAFEYSATRTC